MAVWLLQVGVLEKKVNGHQDLAAQFHADKELRTIRVRNLTAAFFGGMSRPDLAEALLPTNHELASEMAGIEFERAVRLLTRAAPGDISDHPLPPAGDLGRQRADPMVEVGTFTWMTRPPRKRRSTTGSLAGPE